MSLGWDPPLLPLCGCYYLSLVFFLVPTQLYISELCLSGWDEIKAGILSCGLEKLGKLVNHPSLLSW